MQASTPFSTYAPTPSQYAPTPANYAPTPGGYAPTPPAIAFSPPPGASPAPTYPTPRTKFLSPAQVQASLPGHQQQHQQILSHQQRSRSGPPSVASGRGERTTGLEDPVLEARRVLSMLLGTNGLEGEGLLGDLEKGFENCFKRWDAAFEEDGAGPEADGPSLNSLISTLGTLIQILRTSPLGGYVHEESSTEKALRTSTGAGVSAQQMDATSTMVQKLFRERQRGREGAEIAFSVLGSN
ncbi:hypothetical protein T439DRAFT_193857 [Meredithblackwellia eburnea MCA 4105]